MESLNKKQKIMIVFIAITIISIICYYIYSKEEDIEITEELNIVETKEEKEEESIIVVHIAGAVNKEGIVELNQGERISNAIEKAGGLKEGADLKNINLAYVLEDGAKVYIPIIGEDVDIENETQENINGNSNKNNSKKVNINTANQTELETLTGIGPSTALKIIEYRRQNGKFFDIEQVKEVSGIGEMKFEKIKDEIEV